MWKAVLIYAITAVAAYVIRRPEAQTLAHLAASGSSVSFLDLEESR